MVDSLILLCREADALAIAKEAAGVDAAPGNFLLLADAAAAIGNTGQARKIYRKVADGQILRIEALTQLVWLDNRVQRREDSRRTWQRLEGLRPPQDARFTILSFLLRGEADLSEVGRISQRIDLDDWTYPDRMMWAEALIRSGMSVQAEAAICQAVGARTPKATYLLGVCKLVQGDYRNARSQFESVLRDSSSGEVLYHLATCRYKLNELAESAELFDRAARLEQDSMFLQRANAVWQYQHGDWARASQSAKRAMQLGTSDERVILIGLHAERRMRHWLAVLQVYIYKLLRPKISGVPPLKPWMCVVAGPSIQKYEESFLDG